MRNMGIKSSFKLSKLKPEYIIKAKTMKPDPNVSIKPAAWILLNTSGSLINPRLPDKIKKQPRINEIIDKSSMRLCDISFFYFLFCNTLKLLWFPKSSAIHT